LKSKFVLIILILPHTTVDYRFKYSNTTYKTTDTYIQTRHTRPWYIYSNTTYKITDSNIQTRHKGQSSKYINVYKINAKFRNSKYWTEICLSNILFYLWILNSNLEIIFCLKIYKGIVPTQYIKHRTIMG